MIAAHHAHSTVDPMGGKGEGNGCAVGDNGKKGKKGKGREGKKGKGKGRNFQ